MNVPAGAAGTLWQCWGALRRSGEALDGFDADDGKCRDRRNLEAAIGLAQVFLHGFDVEPPGDLLGGGDREVIPSDLDEAAAFVLVFESFALSFGALQAGVGVAERIGERFVRQIVEARCGREILSLGQVYPPWRGLGRVANVSTIPTARLHYAANVYTLPQ